MSVTTEEEKEDFVQNEKILKKKAKNVNAQMIKKWN